MAQGGVRCGVLLLVAGSVWWASAAPRVSEARLRGTLPRSLEWDEEDDSNSLDETAPRTLPVPQFRPTLVPTVPHIPRGPGPDIWDLPLPREPEGSLFRPPPDLRVKHVEPNRPRRFPHLGPSRESVVPHVRPDWVHDFGLLLPPRGPEDSRSWSPPDSSSPRVKHIEPNDPRRFSHFRPSPESVVPLSRTTTRPGFWPPQLPWGPEGSRERPSPERGPHVILAEPNGPRRKPWAPPSPEWREDLHGVVKKPSAETTARPASEERNTAAVAATVSAELPASERTTASAPRSVTTTTTVRPIGVRTPDGSDSGKPSVDSAKTIAPSPCGPNSGAASESATPSPGRDGIAKPPQGVGLSIILTPPYKPPCPDGNKLDAGGTCRDLWLRKGREK